MWHKLTAAQEEALTVGAEALRSPLDFAFLKFLEKGVGKTFFQKGFPHEKGELIMKKVYRLEDLDCANCAAKMEARIKKVEGVSDAAVSFFAQKLTVTTECEDQTEIMKEIVKICRKVEPDCRIILD